MSQNIYFSIIVPVYNRPDEIKELLESLAAQEYEEPFEVVIVEDGSSLDCKTVVSAFSKVLSITYFYKTNSGPGDSRNYGMGQAKGNYFLIFDSDCVLPKDYLKKAKQALKQTYVDFFGGPDAAQESFSVIQKAINVVMTSTLTTGGIRGGAERVGKFQPRSFNMGISKEAFQASGGFGKIHPGEDPDLTIRLWKLGFKSKLFKSVYLFHKRRIDWRKFYLQVNKFGKVRVILNHWHPEYKKVTYWFPLVFVVTFLAALLLSVLKVSQIGILAFLGYFLLLIIVSYYTTRNVLVAFLTIWAVLIQMIGYGVGFFYSFIMIKVLKKQPEEAFPKLFF